ncbi:hypothetical protein HanRHA438_Chr02g0048291 [Helianthus annuus]|uniref:Uncharacterized protein n=1 Tax=Helianthus annuus TaxID=4232 RepID=A0A9K3JJU0_HELAN|nr:hypothetical protein HanXRQr2_Chr02g0047051 [Helianthus annuus]KAJ0613537.1 hypothetical protein HanIR_Chr02g0052461 [Helianthus annuus]KAJ0938303.1 hypothetical protein HanRHA438_Chr02g0048291 [Helianthus annuus]
MRLRTAKAGLGKSWTEVALCTPPEIGVLNSPALVPLPPPPPPPPPPAAPALLLSDVLFSRDAGKVFVSSTTGSRCSSSLEAFAAIAARDPNLRSVLVLGKHILSLRD